MDDSAILQAYINGLPSYGGKIVLSGPMHCTSTINLTNRKHIEIEGQGNGVQIVFATNGKPAFDCLGAERLTFRNIAIHGDQTMPPNVAFFFGRTIAGPNSSWNEFSNVYVDGHFSLGAFYMVSSEVNRWSRVCIDLQGTALAQFGIYIAARNDLELVSEFETLREDIASSMQSFLDYVGVQANLSLLDFVPIIIGDMVSKVHINDAYTFTGGSKNILAIGRHNGIEISNWYCEGVAAHSIYFGAYPSGDNLTRLFRLSQCGLSYSHAGIGMESGTTLCGVLIDNIVHSPHSPATVSVFEFSTLQQARIERWDIPNDTGKMTADMIEDAYIWVRRIDSVEADQMNGVTLFGGML